MENIKRIQIICTTIETLDVHQRNNTQGGKRDLWGNKNKQCKETDKTVE